MPAGDTWLGLQIESIDDGSACGSGLFIAAGLVNEVTGHCTSTDSYTVCTDKDDYTSGETAHVSGSGFAADTELTIKVIRPDSSVVTGDGSFAPWPTAYDTVTTNSSGSFQYDYVLNGIDGEYLLMVLDGPWDGALDTELATHSFTDAGSTILFADAFGSGDVHINNVETDWDVPGYADWDIDSDGGSSDAALRDISNNGYLRIRSDDYVEKHNIDTTGITNIHLEYTWGQDTNWDPSDNGDLVVQWRVSGTGPGNWTTVNTHHLANNSTTLPTANSVDIALGSTAENTSIDIRFWADTNEDNDQARVDNVIVSGDPASGITVTINQASGQDDPTTTSPINFTVFFSESVPDFIDSDVTLSGTAGATTAVVTGSGTTYNVAVSGMTNNGTVIATIPAGAANGDTSGDPNIASSSTDNTVTFAPPVGRTINWATLNGGAQWTAPSPSTTGDPITVTPGETITVELNVTTSGSGDDDDWDSSSWRIGDSGGFTCANTPNHGGDGTYTESFTITTPTTQGTYDAYFRAHNGDSCSTWGGNGSDTFELELAIVVEEVTPEPNPEMGQACGYDLVLVLDMSLSIDMYGQIGTVKDAAKDFVNAFLPGTPSLMGLVEFSGGGETWVGTASIVSDLTSDYDALNTAINGLTASGYTNWEEALLLATDILEGPNDRDDTKHPDMIVIFTDGDPTASSAGASTTTQPNIHLAPAIIAANVAKTSSEDLPIRIVAVGVGTATESRLIAISGPNVADDPSEITIDTDVILTDFVNLASILAELSIQFCGGTITIHKVIDQDGNLNTTEDQITNGMAVENWDYALSITNGTPTSGNLTTDDLGTTEAFEIATDDGPAVVDVTETVKPNHDLFAVVCTGATDIGTFNEATNSMVGIQIDELDIVSCTFYNTPDCPVCYEYDPDTGECVPVDCGYGEWEDDPANPCQERREIKECSADGTCVGTGEYEYRDINCDDGDPCTIDWCDPELGCQHEQLCDDQDGWYDKGDSYPCCNMCCDDDPPPGVNELCASSVAGFYQGDKKDGTPVLASRSDPTAALGTSDGDFVSFGFGGELILAFDYCVGGSVTIYEVTNNSYPLEEVQVLGSIDGSHWISLGTADNTEGMPSESIHPTTLDLGDICIKFIRIIDQSDPAIHNNNADAFDVDAVCGEVCSSPCESSEVCRCQDQEYRDYYCEDGLCFFTVTREQTLVDQCTSCDDGDPCTDDYCEGGVCYHDPIDCDDGDPCTEDYCEGGVCYHDPIDCDDGDPCTEDYCEDGVCYHDPIDCDDGDPCTDDYCEGGVCYHDPIDCDDGDPCTIDECIDGECVHTQIPNCPPTTTTTTTTGGHRTCEFEFDMLGEVVTIRVDCCNDTTYSSHLIFDPGDESFVSLDRNTAVVCGDCVGCGNYPLLVKVTEADVEDFPDPPEGTQIIAAYDCTGYQGDNVCSHVTFGKPIVLLLKYDPDYLGDGIYYSVFIGRLNPDTGEYEPLPPDTGRVAEAGEVTGLTTSFSSFAVLAKLSEPAPEPPEPPAPTPEPPAPTPPSPPPAHFVASGLNIEPSYRLVGIGSPFAFMLRRGESVTITANVGNDGGQQGSYVADLQINGDTKLTKEITLLPGQSQEIVFTAADNKPGHHTVHLGDLSGEFETVVWTNWWLIGGLIAAFGLLIWLAWYYSHRRRRQQ